MKKDDLKDVLSLIVKLLAGFLIIPLCMAIPLLVIKLDCENGTTLINVIKTVLIIMWFTVNFTLSVIYILFPLNDKLP